MTSGFDSFSLALFTTLSPAGVIAYICMSFPLLFTKPENEDRSRLLRYLALPIAMSLIGFIASATHLGTPSNALHVFMGVGRSPLSNEVLSAVVFLFLSGALWMVSFKEKFPAALGRIWLAVACIAGVFFIAMTSLAYSVSTVPTWDTYLTPINLYFSALLAGPILGIFFCIIAHYERPRFFAVLLGLSVSALVVGSIFLFIHQASLNSISNNEFSAAELAPTYALMIVAHIASGLSGILLTGLVQKAKFTRRTQMVLLTLAGACILLAVFIPRIVFYELHMNVGF